jgi:hypothetical protein
VGCHYMKRQPLVELFYKSYYSCTVYTDELEFEANSLNTELELKKSRTVTVTVQVQVTLRLTVSQSVSLGIEHPPGAHDQIFIAPRLLRSCFCGAVTVHSVYLLI